MAEMNADQIASQGFEPQRRYNWILEVPEGGGIIKLALQAYEGPEVTNTPIEINYMNEKRYVPGKAEYRETTLTLVDYVDKDTAKAVYDWYKNTYDPDSGKIGLASKCKKDIQLIYIGPDGSSERRWTLKGAFPSRANFGDLDMTADDYVTLEVTIRYDKAIKS